jgi:fucose permease
MNDPLELTAVPAAAVAATLTSENCHPDARQLRQARWATSALFLSLGLFSGAWGAHIPSMKARFDFSDGEVASVLLAAALGAVLILQVAGTAVARLGVRNTARMAGVGMGVLLALVLIWPSVWLLLPAMLLVGGLGSLFDVALNAEGTVVESVGKRPVMGQLHGMFSLGGMVGAGLCAALMRTGASPQAQLLGMGLLVLVIAVVASQWMLPESTHRNPAISGEAAPSEGFGWPRGPLLLIGLLILCCMLAEGVMYDWSVLYLKDVLHQPQDQAALAYAVFSAAMAGTRLTGDMLRQRISTPGLVRGGALLAGAGMLAALVSGHVGVALGGFVLVGMGLALIVPMLYHAATLMPGRQRAASLAAVSSIGYAGFLLGPPLIGGLAEWLSLGTAMSVVVLVCAILAWGAGRLERLLSPS